MSTRLFIGSLSWNVDSAQLRQLFEEAGEVKDSIVITDKATGRSKGFGFVEMADEESAQRAIDQLNGREIDGRPIAVTEAKPRE